MPVKNVCSCPNPPGGTVTCEPDQMAICIVLDGEARRECQDPPLGSSHAELVDWAVQQVTEGRVSFQTREADLLMLTSGSFERPDGSLVTFALPEGIRDAVSLLVDAALKMQVREEPDYFAR